MARDGKVCEEVTETEGEKEPRGGDAVRARCKRGGKPQGYLGRQNEMEEAKDISAVLSQRRTS